MEKSTKQELVFRIHPAVGIARVGNSEEYVISPETMAGAPGSRVTGGLPIRAGTEADTVTSSDLRDLDGALKRHAARFRIFAYPARAEEAWPCGDGVEITIESKVGDLIVKDIIWTVHVANKKANTFVLVEDGAGQGIAGYRDGALPPVRNPGIDDPAAPQPDDKIAFLNTPERLRRLMIDPGPRTIAGAQAAQVKFDSATPASYCDPTGAAIVFADHYPKSFPATAFSSLENSAGAIDTLGELLTDKYGRLLVLGGYGRAAGWNSTGRTALDADVNNNQWFDDTSDGPVSAALVFHDGSHAQVHGAWVTTTDPSYAPQIPNVVSLWDDVYDAWVRQLGLAPTVYDGAAGAYRQDYKPGFEDQLAPIFRSAALQEWTVNLSAKGASAHKRLAAISAEDNPASTPLAGLSAIFRDPSNIALNNTTLMPLHLGDANQSLLALRQTQYFFLQRWNAGRGNFIAGAAHPLGPGEFLDKATMANCLGGRFSPGIDLTFTMREPAIYQPSWRSSGAGPFRINAKAMPYAAARMDAPFLSAGYIPCHVETDGLEPGDLSKFMAVPWHTDYNSCATHLPSPNPAGNRTLFWSWPAQRPVAVYAIEDITVGVGGDLTGSSVVPQLLLGAQRWSVRGVGTDSSKPENWGRYQVRKEMLDNWHKIGVVLQAPAIDDSKFHGPNSTPGDDLKLEDDWYLEVESRLVDTNLTPVVPFPNYVSADARSLFFKLMNVADHAEVLPDARTFVDTWLKWAQTYSTDPSKAPADLLFFPYTEQTFHDRLELIYQEMVDDAEDFDPGDNGTIFNTYAKMVTYSIQWAPFNLIDGAWLRNIGRTGPMDEVRSLLFSVVMDEMGDGNVSMNHCNIYRDLCHSFGYYPQAIDSEEFASDPQFLDSAFTVPAFQLAISQFSEDYYPELIGMTLYLEWQVVDLKPTRDLMQYVGIDPHFYVMHIGIDNAVNGHGQRAAEAVRLYLENLRAIGAGEEAVQRAWRRIWNGFVAFGSIGSFGQDLIDLVTKPPSLRDQMLAMIARKADYGSRNHEDRMVGGCRINEWFADPPGFLKALDTHKWIIPGDWANSRMKNLFSFETGPMFRVFTDEEITLWADYTASLGASPPVPLPLLSPARAMEALIDQLRPVQKGTAGHVTSMLADKNDRAHTMAWWFEQPAADLMEALASPSNGLIIAGDPAQSRFFTKLISPTGPMGSVFSLPAAAPLSGTYRDLVHAWIVARCPLIECVAQPLRLRLHSPAKRQTGALVGMGGVH